VTPADERGSAAGTGVAGWAMRCPACGHPLGVLPEATASSRSEADHTDADGDADGDADADADADASAVAAIRCTACGAQWPCRDGIWRFLQAEDAARLGAFLAEYTAVRRAEGRAAMTAAERFALPEALSSTPLAWQWRIRAASHRTFCRTVLSGGMPGRVVDVGAGTGWLAWRLAVGGADVLAVDVSDDAGDGLGAGGLYAADLAARGLARRFVRAVAHADRLPVADGAADLVIFNASLHYAVDPAATLAEAARAVRPGGRVVVVDSPIYARHSSGAQMVAERAAAFTARYGYPSTAQGSREFLVAGELERIGAAIGLTFRHARPFVDVRWALRPLTARLRGRRAPARFAVSIGTKRGERVGDRHGHGRESGPTRML
jgi:SAM-dependent methyltransferase